MSEHDYNEFVDSKNEKSEEFIMKKRPKILVVGSLVMNQIAVTCEVPEEGHSVLGTSFHKSPGGRGANQAVQMARLGADVTFVGKIGRDANGDELLEICKKAGIRTGRILHDEDSATGCSVVVLQVIPGEKPKKRSVVIPGANMKIMPDEIASLEHEIGKYDLVLLQNEIPITINEVIAEYAYRKKVPVMLNASPAIQLPREFIRHLTYVVLNEYDAKAMTGVQVHRDRGRFNLEEARVVSAVIRSSGVPNVLVTLGESGVILNTPERFYYKKAVEIEEVVDPMAAGDSFVGAFCTRICLGDGQGKALTIANHAAALTITKAGAMPSLPTQKELKEFMEGRRKQQM